MKKVLALVLAFAMVFSTVSFVFADEEVEEVVEAVEAVEAVVSDEAAALATIGMLEGDGSGVTAEYEAKELDRLTAAIMILKLRGLYEEALEYDGVNNFADAEELKWDGGKKVLAYVKDNPVGFGGNEKGEFMPYEKLSEQMLYKVLLENLGYKQTTDEVVGDFAWDETLEFAESIGLKPAKDEKFTVGGLAKAVVAALKTNTKDGKPWIEVLVEAEKVDEAKAVAAGLMEEAPSVIAVEVKEAKAIGNTVVEVKFKEAVDAAAENLDNYAIEGLEVKGAALAGEKVVRLETAAQTKGKVYKLTVGEVTVKFTGVPKVSGGPAIETVVGEDVEEVVVTFDKNIDLEAGTDVDNYSISGVEIVKAEVDKDEVTLTTEGLKDKTKYTLKVTNIKSIDGVSKKATSKSFTTKFDKTAPKIKGDIEVQTNQRIVLTFTEKVTQESAEELDNYEIKINKTDGDELEVVSIAWDDDDEDNVEIITEPMENRKEYKLTVNNIEDQRKVANVITRPVSKTFKGIAEDTKGPEYVRHTVLSPTTILVEFKDDSKIDEDSSLDFSNYVLEDLDIEDIETVTNKHQVCKVLLTVEEMETGKSYKLTISDILDEFGNEMKEKKVTVKALAGTFASARPLGDGDTTLTGVYATGKNKVKVVFDKEVDKATAEDISNYKINKDIGSPTKAKLESDKKTVTLDVNDLINSTKVYYKLTIDGVEDLAGNVLYFKEYKVDTKKEKWDTTAPALENVDVLNIHVVAIEFDEKVVFEPGAELKLKDDKGADYTLVAKDYTDDDTVVEFSNLGKELKADKRFTIVEIVYGIGEDGGIKDSIGNPFKSSSIDADLDFQGSDEAPEAVEMESYEQINGKTFEVVMSRNVDYASGKDKDSVTGWKITIEDNEITFVKDEVIKEVDYEFNFSELFVDLHGVAVADDYEKDTDHTKPYTILAGDYEDDEEPWIDDVVAKNRWLVEIVFNEDIDASTIAVADFALRNYDLDKTITFTVNKIEDNKVTLKANNALEARYEYELEFKKGEVIKDVAGNSLKSDGESFYFQGTNLADLVEDK